MNATPIHLLNQTLQRKHSTDLGPLRTHLIDMNVVPKLVPINKALLINTVELDVQSVVPLAVGHPEVQQEVPLAWVGCLVVADLLRDFVEVLVAVGVVDLEGRAVEESQFLVLEAGLEVSGYQPGELVGGVPGDVHERPEAC